MITKKLWNSFTDETRVEIIEIYYGRDFDSIPSKYQRLKTSYNHDFDFDIAGEALKKILATCYLQKDGKINIIVSLTPMYAPKATKTVSKPVKTTPQELKESFWYVDYEDKSGDLCHVWIKAYNEQGAIEKAKREYWNIAEIINVRKG